MVLTTSSAVVFVMSRSVCGSIHAPLLVPAYWDMDTKMALTVWMPMHVGLQKLASPTPSPSMSVPLVMRVTSRNSSHVSGMLRLNRASMSVLPGGGGPVCAWQYVGVCVCVRVCVWGGGRGGACGRVCACVHVCVWACACACVCAVCQEQARQSCGGWVRGSRTGGWGEGQEPGGG